MRQRAFTLIELLVVIAIIAILAAILFPVFAQAKMAAKKSAALNQVKQIGTAMQLYVSDSDDVTPHVSSGGTNNSVRTDVWYTMQPYCKNMDIWFSGERTETGCFLNNNNPDIVRLNTTGRCNGYGYNWGAQIYAGGGLLQPEQQFPGGGSYQAGISMTSMEEPANVYAFGDTFDTPRYTIGMYPNSAGGKAWILDTFNVTAQTKQSAFRYNGRFNMSYADSHAKNVQFKGGLTTGVGYVYVPSKERDRLGYCANPDNALDGSRFGAGTLPCRDFIKLPETRGTQWSPE